MEENKKKFPDKKDMGYWIIILIMLIVILIVWRVDQPKVLSDQIALGAALFSILLAVVGIIIPYIQGNETNRQNFQMLSEINRITESIVGLSSLKDELSRNISQQMELSKKYAEIIESTEKKLESVESKEEDKQEKSYLLEQLKVAKDEMKEKMHQIEKQSLFFNDLPTQIRVTNQMREIAILNFLKANFKHGAISLTSLRQHMIEENMLVSKPDLRRLLSLLENRGQVKIYDVDGIAHVELVQNR